MKILKHSCEVVFRSTALTCRRANGSKRAFSQSLACQRGHLPSFHKPSSPELSYLLSHLNSKILLPCHLNHDQELLVYKERYRSRVEAEPINIQLGDVELPLEHIDRTKDKESRWKVIKTVVELAREPEDWENVIKMLEGFHEANIKLKGKQLQKVIRRANVAGMQHVILKALQKVHTTGLSLKEPMVLEAVLHGVHDKASKSGWEKEDVKKALSYSEQVVELMEKDEHLGSGMVMRGDPRSSPFVISVPLELAAVRAKKFLNGQDADGKVAKYALRLMAAFKQDKFMEETLPALIQEQLCPEYAGVEDLRQRKGMLEQVKGGIHRWVRAWNGLRTASSVLGADMPMLEDAAKIEDMIRKALTTAEQAIRDLSPVGVDVDASPRIKALRECEESI